MGILTYSHLKFWDGIVNVIPAFKVRAAYGKAGIQPGAFDRYQGLNLQPTGNELAYTSQTGLVVSLQEIQTSMLKFLQKKK